MKPEYLEVIYEAGRTPECLGQLDPAFKARWLEALRSGRYSQTKGALQRIEPSLGHHAGKLYPEGHCCLGVAADLIDPSAWSPFAGLMRWKLCTGDLPFPAARDVGLTPETQNMLQRLNDDWGWTFTQIADFIEEVL